MRGPIVRADNFLGDILNALFMARPFREEEQWPSANDPDQQYEKMRDRERNV